MICVERKPYRLFFSEPVILLVFILTTEEFQSFKPENYSNETWQNPTKSQRCILDMLALTKNEVDQRLKGNIFYPTISLRHYYDGVTRKLGFRFVIFLGNQNFNSWYPIFFNTIVFSSNSLIFSERYARLSHTRMLLLQNWNTMFLLRDKLHNFLFYNLSHFQTGRFSRRPFSRVEGWSKHLH